MIGTAVFHNTAQSSDKLPSYPPVFKCCLFDGRDFEDK